MGFFSGSLSQAAPWAANPYYSAGASVLGMDPSNPFGSGPFGSAPQPGSPDYVGAAEATAAASRINQYNPFGSSVWSQGPEGQWSQTQAFSPGQQGLFDVGQAGKAQMLGSQMPGFGENRQRVMEAMMGRGMGDIGRSREQAESKLIAQGIPKGSEAYETEMDRFSRQEVDLRQQAEIGATQQAGQEYGAQMMGRGQRFGELMGMTPGLPQFGQTPPGADYMSAAMAQGQFDMGAYNAQQAQKNAMMQGLFGLGAAGIMGSDRRLKHSIKKIGNYIKGIDIFEFSYKGSMKKFTGVMSDQVRKIKPEAVIRFNDGYDRVIYGNL